MTIGQWMHKDWISGWVWSNEDAVEEKAIERITKNQNLLPFATCHANALPRGVWQVTGRGGPFLAQSHENSYLGMLKDLKGCSWKLPVVVIWNNFFQCCLLMSMGLHILCLSWIGQGFLSFPSASLDQMMSWPGCQPGFAWKSLLYSLTNADDTTGYHRF